VLLYDNWDVWKVPVNPSAGRAVNLTGDGRRTQVRYNRSYTFEAIGGGLGRFGGPGPGTGVDLSKPLYFGTYGEWTKKEGISRVDPGSRERCSWPSTRHASTSRRRATADVFLYTRQNFTEFPNWRVYRNGFKDSYQITDVNPQMKDLAWSSGTRLIDYRSDKGDKLQGALYLPANYQPGKKYPLLVTIYERRSQNMRSFVSPADTRAPDPSIYTSHGYAVLDPDIVYRVNDPGYVRGVVSGASGEGRDRDRPGRPGQSRALGSLVGRLSNRLPRDADEHLQGGDRGRSPHGHGEHVQLRVLEHGRDEPGDLRVEPGPVHRQLHRQLRRLHPQLARVPRQEREDAADHPA
jgi:hypothetical protein